MYKLRHILKAIFRKRNGYEILNFPKVENVDKNGKSVTILLFEVTCLDTYETYANPGTFWKQALESETVTSMSTRIVDVY